MKLKAAALLTSIFLLLIVLNVYIPSVQQARGYAESIGYAVIINSPVKWDHLNLKLGIDNKSNDPNLNMLLIDAASEWETAFSALSVTVVDYKDCEICVHIDNRSESLLLTGTDGGTSIKGGDNIITRADIYMQLYQYVVKAGNNTVYIRYPYLTMYYIFMHEFGHALNLFHAQGENMEYPIDIMYEYVTNEPRAISQIDVDALNNLYSQEIEQTYNKHIISILTTAYDLFEDKSQFKPNIISINQNDIVTWFNQDYGGKDGGRHTVTSGVCNVEQCDDKWGTVFDSGRKVMKPGDTFTVTFNERGEYPYLCALHPWMVGKIIVN